MSLELGIRLASVSDSKFCEISKECWIRVTYLVVVFRGARIFVAKKKKEIVFINNYFFLEFFCLVCKSKRRKKNEASKQKGFTQTLTWLTQISAISQNLLEYTYKYMYVVKR